MPWNPVSDVASKWAVWLAKKALKKTGFQWGGELFTLESRKTEYNKLEHLLYYTLLSGRGILSDPLYVSVLIGLFGVSIPLRAGHPFGRNRKRRLR